MGRPQVAASAMLMCSFGVAPATLGVLPSARVLVEGRPAAAITDAAPVVNVPPFGMCTSLANPTVAAATAAALGVLTPMPCVPATTPWVGGSTTVLVGGRPALVQGSTCQCAFGGVVQVVVPSTVTTQTG